MSVRTVKVAVGELREHPDNPRTITAEALDRLKQSMLADPEMLEVRPVIALPDGRVIGGNMRLRAARELGWPELWVAYVDLDDKRAVQWMLRDNNGYGEWETDMLAAMLRELEPDERLLTGFDEIDLKVLLDDAPLPEGIEAPAGGGYSEQYGVIVICEDEEHQEQVFERLQGDGLEVRVVVT